MSHIELTSALESLNKFAEEIKEVPEDDQTSPTFKRRINSNERVRPNEVNMKENTKET